MSGFSGFPKGLSYAISRLDNFSKQTVKLYSDCLSTTINPGDIIRVKLPVNSLCDLRTFSMFFTGSCSSNGNTTTNVYTQGYNFPRNTESIIDNLSIHANGVQIENIPAYNQLFNALWDLNGGGLETLGKTYMRNTDPSLKCRLLQTGVPTFTTVEAINGGAANAPNHDGFEGTNTDVGRKLLIANWCGFLSSSSTEIVDTADIPEIWIEIRLAQANILWKQALQNGVAGAQNTPNYTIRDVYFTISRCSFYDPLYYEIKSAALMNNGLQIAYNTYSAFRGARTTKDINMQIQVNARSLNALIAVPLFDTYANGGDFLQLTTGASTAAGGGKTFINTLANLNAGATQNTYNQSTFFVRDGAGITTSQMEVNNVPVTHWPLTTEEVFNEALIAFNAHQDTLSGCHPGLNSIAAFQKWYWTHISSLDFRQSSSDYLICGVDGRQASINVKWTCVKDSANTTQVYPIIWASKDEVINIGAGGVVSILQINNISI